MRVSKNVAVVMGAAQGIGEAIAKILASAIGGFGHSPTTS